jgi:hypothetical protein
MTSIFVPWLLHSDQSDCSIAGVYFSYTPPRRCISRYIPPMRCIFFCLGPRPRTEYFLHNHEPACSNPWKQSFKRKLIAPASVLDVRAHWLSTTAPQSELMMGVAG